ncbi:MAG: hypothetical protein IT209_13290 [Armatimonadetes bacterium]|nr:hypothetical protein [Armatimonadota bacterium]
MERVQTQAEQTVSGVTWRAILLGLLLTPVNTYWVTIVEVRWYTLDGTSLPLFITPVFILFVLCLLNLLALKLRPRHALNRAELTVVYVMLVVSCVLSGHDMLQNMFGAITHPYYYASPENEYQKLFFRFLPKFLFVRDELALKDFYIGNTNPWTSGLWRFWVLPLSMWGIFLVALLSMMLAASVILRRAWTQNEKLVFPLIQLPVAMAASAEGGGIFNMKALWYGFAVAATITFVNGMHTLYPQLPWLPAVKQYDIGTMFSSPPWNAVGYLPISMYPFAIGIAFFIPLDLSFSCWFFFVLSQLFKVLGRTQGWDAATNVGFPFFGEQAAGAWLGLGMTIVWGARHYLKSVWRQAVGTEPEHEAGEARDYRIALGTIALGCAFLAFWSMLLGIAWWIAILFFGIYLLLSLTITRVRAELGTPHEIYFVNPQTILTNTFGTTLGGHPQSLTAICTMYWFQRGMRCHPMPNMMESFKMAEYAKIHRRKMVGVLALALVVGIAVTYWANLQVTYEAGASSKALGFKWWLGTESFRDKLMTWLKNPESPSVPRIIAMVAGLAVVVSLRSLRLASIDFPFHPAGYALAVSFAMNYFWFAFFLAWVAKSLIVRYGGMKFHNAAVPFFLGLILGDYVMGSIWAIIGPVLGIQTYRVFI